MAKRIIKPIVQSLYANKTNGVPVMSKRIVTCSGHWEVQFSWLGCWCEWACTLRAYDSLPPSGILLITFHVHRYLPREHLCRIALSKVCVCLGSFYWLCYRIISLKLAFTVRVVLLFLLIKPFVSLSMCALKQIKFRKTYTFVLRLLL